MTDEVKPVDGEQVVTEQPEQTQTPELSDIEKRALDMGWRPKEEFDGEEDDFIDAKEFVRRKPLFDKIEKQSKEIKRVVQALDALKTHYTKVQETEYNRALNALKEARQEAISNADGEAFDKIDNQIKQVEKQREEINQLDVPETPTVPQEFIRWTEKNSWYNTVGYMRKFADDVGVELHKQGMTPEKVLQEVEKAVRKEFPQKFTNPNKAAAPDVESGKGTGKTSGGNKSGELALTEQERKIMNTLVSTGQITKEKYLSDLKKIKGLN